MLIAIPLHCLQILPQYQLMPVNWERSGYKHSTRIIITSSLYFSTPFLGCNVVSIKQAVYVFKKATSFSF